MNAKDKNTDTLTKVKELPVMQPKNVLSVPILAIMISKGYSDTAIARHFNISVPAVTQYKKRHREELIDVIDYDERIISKLKHKVMEVVNGVNEQKIKKANLKDSFISTGIGIEKIQLLQGKATQVVDYHRVSAEEEKLRKQLEEFEDQEARTIDVTPRAPLDVVEGDENSHSEGENDPKRA